jgi:hypothetical protein
MALLHYAITPVPCTPFPSGYDSAMIQGADSASAGSTGFWCLRASASGSLRSFPVMPRALTVHDSAMVQGAYIFKLAAQVFGVSATPRRVW